MTIVNLKKIYFKFDINFSSLRKLILDMKESKLSLSQKIFLFTCYKKCTAATIKFLFGLQNGATSHFLAVVQAQKVESLLSLTTTFLSKFFDYVRTQIYGRFIICDIETEGRCITLATLYAPNEDEPSFFQDFFDHLSDFQCDDLIIGGDFNLILDLDKDKKGGRYKTHTRSVKALKEFIVKLDLIDAWRVLNPNTLRYTWRRKKPEIQCRLDFFLVTQSLMCNVTHAGITMGLYDPICCSFFNMVWP